MHLSIVIPTFNERDNVRLLVERIDRTLHGWSKPYEVWFIDDSRDDTPNVLAELARSHPHVHYVHRTAARGLATAVVEGFRRSRGRYLVVMDADLQHPPELLPVMVERLEQGFDLVIPSRFVPGGSDGGLNAFRKLVSWTARTLGRLALHRLRRVSDCTGGYFGLRREVIEGVELDPVGWKILMEVLVKGRYETVREIPYSFEARDAGESKMSWREQWNYLRHLVRLIKSSPEDRRFYIYCGVGALGVVVNSAVMSALVYGLHWHPTLASVIASLIAMGHNFLWNDRVTWRSRPQSGRRRALQLPLFMLVSASGIALTALAVQLFLWLGWPPLLGQWTGIIAATAWTYTANNRWTWNPAAQEEQKQVARRVRVTQE